MGKVYRAEQSPLGRVCAVKVLNPNYDGRADPEFHKRFYREASIASKITHPNTVTIFDYGKTEDEIYLHGDGVSGGPDAPQGASVKAGRCTHIPRGTSAHIPRHISCRALREAHSLGVIHRDLKPANISPFPHPVELTGIGRWVRLDGALVRRGRRLRQGARFPPRRTSLSEEPEEQLTQTGLFMGAAKYMAPEQYPAATRSTSGRTSIRSASSCTRCSPARCPSIAPTA